MIQIDGSARYFVDGLDGVVAAVDEHNQKICLADLPDGSRDFFECNGERPTVLLYKHWIGRRTQGYQGSADQYQVKHVIPVHGFVILLTLDEWRQHGHKTWEELVSWDFEHNGLQLGARNHQVPRDLRK